MATSSNPTQPFTQTKPLPVALSLELPAAEAPDLPVLSRFCTLPIGEPHAPISWLELLGER
ncbi:MAG: hypothetical protein RLZZ206_1726 [Cyanobacteriota bacterium]|jgi:hypothetical protein